MRTILAITKALADLNRIRLLVALSQRGELCVCQLQEFLGIAASSTSKHLSLLAGAGLVVCRKEGRWAYYRLAEGDEVPEGAHATLQWLCTRAAKEKVILDDRRKLNEILAYSPEALCQMQARGVACCSSAPATPASAKSPKAGRAQPSMKPARKDR